MDSEQKMNAGVKVVCAVVLVAVVTAAGVGLLVQHRKLREQRLARASLEHTNQRLVTSREELESANGKLAGELCKLRDAERARVAANEKERAAWKAEREALERRMTAVSAEVKKVRAAQSRAGKEAAALKAQVKDLTSANKRLRAEREKLHAKCDSLERELNEAMQPAREENGPSPAPLPVPTGVPPSAPQLNSLTPEEREAHEKEELNDLLNIR